MPDVPIDPDLTETLRDAQRLGFFGDRPIEEAIEHSHAFVRVIGGLPAGGRIVDIGSGGGLPGLVLAAADPATEVWLVDRRRRRADFLERAVRRHRWRHVTVRCADVADVARAVDRGELAPFDVVTARGFGPPETTLRVARSLLAPTGWIVISEPPTGDRWPPPLLEELALRSERRGPVRVFAPTDSSE